MPVAIGQQLMDCLQHTISPRSTVSSRAWAVSLTAEANSKGAFGTNLGDGKGDPVTTAASIGYIYNMARGLSAYAYYTKVYNNEHAKLGTNSFRGDTSSFGYNPSEWTLGMFYVF